MLLWFNQQPVANIYMYCGLNASGPEGILLVSTGSQSIYIARILKNLNSSILRIDVIKNNSGAKDMYIISKVQFLTVLVLSYDPLIL